MISKDKNIQENGSDIISQFEEAGISPTEGFRIVAHLYFTGIITWLSKGATYDQMISVTTGMLSHAFETFEDRKNEANKP